MEIKINKQIIHIFTQKNYIISFKVSLNNGVSHLTL